MNKVEMMGRLTRDPEVRYTNGQNGEQMAIARYSLAVDRKGKDAGADFIPCVAFGRLGETAEKYFKKGTKLVVVGRIRTDSYTNKNGQKIYTTDVIVEEQEFAESKAASSQEDSQQTAQPAAQPVASPQEDEGFEIGPDDGGFQPIPTELLGDLPFN